MSTETASPKAQLIAKVNHNWMKITGDQITTEEFDELYGKTEDELENIIIRMELHLRSMQQLQEMAARVARHMNEWAKRLGLDNESEKGE